MITSINEGYRPVFQARVSDNFVKAAHNYFNGVEYCPKKSRLFDEKVAKVFNDFGYDEFVIGFKKIRKDNKTFYALYAKNDEIEVPLTEKDKFRKVIEKFMRMKKGELYIKIKQFRLDHPELKPLNANIDF